MIRLHTALTAALFCLTALAATADPIGSTACRTALAALQSQEEVTAAARLAPHADDPGAAGSAEARHAALRRKAAQTCLGGTGDPPPPAGHVMQAPIVVRPIASLRQSRPVPPPAPSALSPPLPAAPSGALTGCDANGCWSADGVRLNRVGPYLSGPLGLCHAQGTQLICP